MATEIGAVKGFSKALDFEGMGNGGDIGKKTGSMLSINPVLGQCLLIYYLHLAKKASISSWLKWVLLFPKVVVT